MKHLVEQLRARASFEAIHSEAGSVGKSSAESCDRLEFLIGRQNDGWSTRGSSGFFPLRRLNLCATQGFIRHPDIDGTSGTGLCSKTRSHLRCGAARNSNRGNFQEISARALVCHDAFLQKPILVRETIAPQSKCGAGLKHKTGGKVCGDAEFGPVTSTTTRRK